MNSQHRTSESFEHWQKRMLFACKRGNIETELLLLKFIQKLNPAEYPQRNLIESLLNESEQDLFHWLIKPQQTRQLAHHATPPEKYHTLISEIQNVYLKK